MVLFPHTTANTCHLLCFICDPGNWSQSSVHAKQVIYQLSMSKSSSHSFLSLMIAHQWWDISLWFPLTFPWWSMTASFHRPVGHLYVFLQTFSNLILCPFFFAVFGYNFHSLAQSKLLCPFLAQFIYFLAYLVPDLDTSPLSDVRLTNFCSTFRVLTHYIISFTATNFLI